MTLIRSSTTEQEIHLEEHRSIAASRLLAHWLGDLLCIDNKRLWKSRWHLGFPRRACVPPWACSLTAFKGGSAVFPVPVANEIIMVTLLLDVGQ